MDLNGCHLSGPVKKQCKMSLCVYKWVISRPLNVCVCVCVCVCVRACVRACVRLLLSPSAIHLASLTVYITDTVLVDT